MWSLCTFAQDLGVAWASRQRLEAGDYVEQLFIDRFLSNTAEGAGQIFQNVFYVLFRALHRRQTAGVFAGKGFRTGLKKQNKEVSSDESRKRRFGSFDDLRQILCRPCHCCSLCCQA